MSDSDDPRVSLWREALESYEAEHGLLSDRWKAVETKAQGTVAIAGIFTAGIFAFVRDLSGSNDSIERWMLSIISLLLTLTIFLAVLVLRIRQVQDPPYGGETQRIVGDLALLPKEEIVSRTPDSIRERLEGWVTVNQKLRSSIGIKAKTLGIAQLLLLFTAILMCGLLIFSAFKSV